MELQRIEHNGKTYLQGPAGQPLLRKMDEATRLVEACMNEGTDGLLLYAENLTDRFFDLSSTEAGNILPKLRQYRIRLAVVWSAEIRPLSTHFAELMVEENREPYFRLFEKRDEAEAWLTR